MKLNRLLWTTAAALVKLASQWIFKVKYRIFPCIRDNFHLALKIGGLSYTGVLACT